MRAGSGFELSGPTHVRIPSIISYVISNSGCCLLIFRCLGLTGFNPLPPPSTLIERAGGELLNAAVNAAGCFESAFESILESPAPALGAAAAVAVDVCPFVRGLAPEGGEEDRTGSDERRSVMLSIVLSYPILIN